MANRTVESHRTGGPGRRNDDARYDPRYAFALRAAATLDGRPVTLQTDNVSDHGAFLKTDRPARARQLVRLEFNPRDEKPFTMAAMIVHVVPPSSDREGGFGVRFVGLEGKDRDLWERVVRKARLESETASSRSTREPYPVMSSAECSAAISCVELAITFETLRGMTELVEHEVLSGEVLVPTELPIVTGVPVSVQLIHPFSREVFYLDGVVAHWERSPRGVARVKLAPLGRNNLRQLRDFVSGRSRDEEDVSFSVAEVERLLESSFLGETPASIAQDARADASFDDLETEVMGFEPTSFRAPSTRR